MKSNIIKYIFIIVVIGLFIYACYLLYGKKEENISTIQDTEKPVQEEVQKITNLRIPIVNFDTINPILSKNQDVQDIARLIYEPLLNVSTGNKIELCLAKEWTKLNESTYVIKLKEGIKWQNGDSLTAKDVKFTVDILKDININSIYSYQVQDIVNLEIIDDNTIKIELSKEIPFFEYNLTFPILSYKYYENENFIDTTKNSAPVGTGRFQVRNENGKISLEKNPNWWNIKNEPTQITEIQINSYENMGEVYNAFKIGNIDILNTNTLNLEDYIGTIGYNKKEFHGRNLDYIAMNCESKIFSYSEVRKAISYLIPKENIISEVFKDKYYISNFPLDIGNYLYENGQVLYERNSEKAIEILEQSGWQYNKNTWKKTENYRTIKLQFDLIVNIENAQRISVAEIIKRELESFGIQVNIKKATNTQYQKYLENKNYDMLLTGIYTGYSPDLSTYFGENNLANYKNEEVTKLLKECNQINDEKQLKDRYKKIIEIYETDMPYIFLYYNRKTLVYSPKLMGEINPDSYNIYKGINTWYRQ